MAGTGNRRATRSGPRAGARRGRPLRRAGALLGLVGCLLVVAGGAGTTGHAGPVRSAAPPAPPVVPGEYIVVFADDAPPGAVADAEARIARLGGTVLSTYRWALRGLSARVPPGAEDALRALPGVDHVTADVTGTAATSQPPDPSSLPPNGLDRLDRRLPLPLDHRYTYSETGAGVHVYVLDTGIRPTHQQFAGRMGAPHDFVTGDGSFGTDDCNGTGSGHGTRMAGTIAGTIDGVAKGATLHALKVVPCLTGSPNLSSLIAAVDWLTGEVTAHPATATPAVANVSLEFPGLSSTTLDDAVKNSIAAGVTYVIAAGNDNADACSVSPARVPQAITVAGVNTLGFGSVTDNRLPDSNFGPCVNLFAPGESIRSADNASDTAQLNGSGTSPAAAHVSGVAARFLQTHPLATPAAVASAIHAAADVSSTPNWPGVGDPGVGSPDELLHWGSLNDGVDDGDPHLTTVDGLRYDFQSAGEFVLLRGAGVEIQARQTPVSTAGPLADPSTGLTSCVSVNTAVAAGVNGHRVTLDSGPRTPGTQPGEAALRVDGERVAEGSGAIDLGRGGSVTPSAEGLEVRFPDGTVLVATRNWWASQGIWYLSLGVLRTSADAGLLGAGEPGDWLPRLSDGSSAGSLPASLNDRFVGLYTTFADSWRVTKATSLFDYAPGTSTDTFTLPGWPSAQPCVAPDSPVATPLPRAVAKRACAALRGDAGNCIADVAVTGETGFADAYRAARAQRSATTSVVLSAGGRVEGRRLVVAAVVVRSAGGAAPTGRVQFSLDGMRSKQIRLDAAGRARWTTPPVAGGVHLVGARYVPDARAAARPSAATLRRRVR